MHNLLCAIITQKWVSVRQLLNLLDYMNSVNVDPSIVPHIFRYACYNTAMAIIAQTSNFLIEAHDEPEVSRIDGGHIVISPIATVTDRTELSAPLASELMLLTILTGKAMKHALAEQGISLGRINYQDNGNWKPELHIHLYGRAVDATYHPFGHPLRAAWTLEEKRKIKQEALNTKDIELIKHYLIEFSKAEGFEHLHLY